MQIVSMETICMKCQNLFSQKKKKKNGGNLHAISNPVFWEKNKEIFQYMYVVC